MVPRALLSLCLAGALASAATAAPPPGGSMLGFDDAAKQRDLEARFDAVLKADNLREWMRRLSARPHAIGSPYQRENAEFIAAQFRSWGYDTQIEEFQVLFPTPKTRVLQMTAPTRFTARLAEPEVKGDRSSARVKEGCRSSTPTPATATSPLPWST